MIDLFRPFMAPQAKQDVYDLLIPVATNEHDVPGRDGKLYIGQGKKVDAFEQALAVFLASRQEVLSLNSCTSALDLALHLCDVGGQAARNSSALSPRSNVVISTPMTCTATNSPIVTRGGSIVWADVDPLTGLISPASVAECIDLLWSHHRTIPNAIMAVDWAGNLTDYPRLTEIAVSPLSGDRIPIIQDAAHSFGATVEKGVPFMDTDHTSQRWHGEYVCFSFQAIKALTTGDGGALICPTAEITDRARLLRWYGLDRRSSEDFRCRQDIQEVGYKYHMNDIAAVLGLANLPYVDANLDQQRANANYYGGLLGDLTGVIIPPAVQGHSNDLDSPWWLFTVLVSDRDNFQAFMTEQGIQTSPVHARNDLHGAFFDAATPPTLPLPGVDFFADHEVAIPVGWWLTPSQRDQVADAVCSWSKQHGRELSPPQTAGV